MVTPAFFFQAYAIWGKWEKKNIVEKENRKKKVYWVKKKYISALIFDSEK